MKFKVLLTKSLFLLLVLSFMLLSAELGYAQGSGFSYSQALKAARKGDDDFAFMYFKECLRKDSKSKFAPKALFAIGEYYFSNRSLAQASKAFAAFVNRYPKSKSAVFAYSYLMVLAKKDQNQSLVQEFKRKIIAFQKLKLLFSDFKEYKYRSPFFNKYKAIYFIDRVEIYINGKLFAEVLY